MDDRSREPGRNGASAANGNGKGPARGEGRTAGNSTRGTAVTSFEWTIRFRAYLRESISARRKICSPVRRGVLTGLPLPKD